MAKENYFSEIFTDLVEQKLESPSFLGLYVYPRELKHYNLQV